MSKRPSVLEEAQISGLTYKVAVSSGKFSDRQTPMI